MTNKQNKLPSGFLVITVSIIILISFITWGLSDLQFEADNKENLQSLKLSTEISDIEYLGHKYLKNKQFGLATDYFRKASSIQNDSIEKARLLSLLSVSLLEEEKNVESLEAIYQSLLLNVDNQDSYDQLNVSYSKIKDDLVSEEYKNKINNIPEINKDNIDFNNPAKENERLGHLSFLNNEFSDSSSLFRQASEAETDVILKAKLLGYLTTSLLREEKYIDALDASYTAISFDPLGKDYYTQINYLLSSPNIGIETKNEYIDKIKAIEGIQYNLLNYEKN